MSVLLHDGRGNSMAIRETVSINDIRTTIHELSIRAELAHKEGRHEDAAEIEQRIQGYRKELGHRP
jgi:propanediol dehydratase small subunit